MEFNKQVTKIYEEIREERKRQDVKWGVQDHSPDWWMLILGEEFGEVCEAILEGSMQDYKKELIHVAAVAVAALENLYRNNDSRNF